MSAPESPATVSPAEFDARCNAEVDRIRRELRELVRQSPRTQREIEERLGLGRQYLSYVLTRKANLSVRHVLGILRCLDVRPEDFFARLGGRYDFGPPPSDEVAEPADYLRELERLTKLTGGS